MGVVPTLTPSFLGDSEHITAFWTLYHSAFFLGGGGFVPAFWVSIFLGVSFLVLPAFRVSFIGLVMDLVVPNQLLRSVFGYHTSFLGPPAFRVNFGQTSFKGILGQTSFQGTFLATIPAFWV